jgi:hypothetical protein
VVSLLVHRARPPTPVSNSAFHRWLAPDDSVWVEFFRVDGGTLVRFADTADFLIAPDGLSVQVWPAEGISSASYLQLFHNHVRPLALSRAGKLILHAGAVAIDGRAVAFVGASGSGKSTLAASFARRGFALIADDGLLLDHDRGDYRAAPGEPSFRLWEDSEEVLVTPDTPVAPPVDFTDKRRFLEGGPFVFCTTPTRLARVYLLGESGDAEARISPLRGREALVPLLEHAFLLDVDRRDARRAQLRALAELAETGMVHRLDYPRDYAMLPELHRAIIEHATRANPAKLTGNEASNAIH